MPRKGRPMAVNGIPFPTIAAAAGYMGVEACALRHALDQGATTYCSREFGYACRIEELSGDQVIKDWPTIFAPDEDPPRPEYPYIDALLARQDRIRYGGLLGRTQVCA